MEREGVGDARVVGVASAPVDYFLRSERLGFRRWRTDDLELAVELWGDPAVARHIQAAPPSRTEVARRLEEALRGQSERGLAYWPIFALTDGAHVGCCGLRPRAPQVPEFGVHLRPAYWGRGLALEAGRAVIDHAFATLGARALFAGHHPDNHSSRALLLRLGFQHTHDEIYPPTGRLHPSYLRAPG